MILRVGFSWIPLRCRHEVRCSIVHFHDGRKLGFVRDALVHSSAFSHCVQESDSSRLFCKHLPVQLWSNAAAFWHPYRKSHCVSFCSLCQHCVSLLEGQELLKKVVRAGTPVRVRPEGAASTFGIYLGYCMYLHEIPWFCSVAAICAMCALAAYEPLMAWWILESLNNFEPPGRIVC